MSVVEQVCTDIDRARALATSGLVPDEGMDFVVETRAVPLTGMCNGCAGAPDALLRQPTTRRLQEPDAQANGRIYVGGLTYPVSTSGFGEDRSLRSGVATFARSPAKWTTIREGVAAKRSAA